MTRCCTWCDVCLMGGRTGMWPTTSTYTGECCSPICYPFWLTASLRTGLTARGASCLAPRRLRTAGLPDPIAQEGPPRIEQASTPIMPAGYGGGANPAHRVQAGEMGRARKEGPAGAVGKPPQQLVSERGAARKTTGGLTPGMVDSGEAATEGRSDEKRRQNRARIKLHGSSNRGKRGPEAMETPAS